MDSLGFFSRLGVAWRVLFDGALAARIDQPIALPLAAALPETLPEPAPVAPAVADHTAALQLLAILQREGRFVDFLEEDISSFGDADLGAAARVVHQGCKQALADYITVEPLRTEAEGDAVVLEAGFDPARTLVTGNVVGQPPFRGKLAHHGWRASEVRLPALAADRDPTIVAPAEVEL